MSSYSNPLSAFDELDIVNQEQSVEPNYINNLLGDTSGDLPSTNQALAQAGIEPALSSGRLTTPVTSFGQLAQQATNPAQYGTTATSLNPATVQRASGVSASATPTWLTALQAAFPALNLLDTPGQLIAIIVGLILIAGAVFGFKNIANTVIETGKGAVKEGGKVAVAGAVAGAAA